MPIALTGTPGTGKTAAASLLTARGFEVTTVEAVARQNDCAIETDDGVEVDIEALSAKMKLNNRKRTILDGHLAHLLPNSLCVVLRCHPDLLRTRLEERGYTEEKVRENVEAEAIDIILVEALDTCDRVFEIDATALTPEAVADSIERIINGNGDDYLPGRVDWSQVVSDWY
jgi:adenylate kinase